MSIDDGSGTFLHYKNAAKKELLMKDREYYLIQCAKSGDRDARDALVKHNIRLVYSVAGKFRTISNARFSVDDMIQEGTIGLLKAIEGFNVKRGYRLSTYAVWWIRTGIVSAIADQSRLIRVPINVHSKLMQLRKKTAELYAKNHREPTHEELACALGYTLKEIQDMIAWDRKDNTSFSSSGERDSRDKKLVVLDSLTRHSVEYDFDDFLMRREELDQCIMIIIKITALIQSTFFTETRRRNFVRHYGLDGSLMVRSLVDIGRETSLSPGTIGEYERRIFMYLRRCLRIELDPKGIRYLVEYIKQYSHIHGAQLPDEMFLYKYGDQNIQ